MKERSGAGKLGNLKTFESKKFSKEEVERRNSRHAKPNIGASTFLGTRGGRSRQEGN